VKYSGHKNFTVYSKTIQCEQKLATQPFLLVVLLPYCRADSPSYKNSHHQLTMTREKKSVDFDKKYKH